MQHLPTTGFPPHRSARSTLTSTAPTGQRPRQEPRSPDARPRRCRRRRRSPRLHSARSDRSPRGDSSANPPADRTYRTRHDRAPAPQRADQPVWKTLCGIDETVAAGPGLEDLARDGDRRPGAGAVDAACDDRVCTNDHRPGAGISAAGVARARSQSQDGAPSEALFSIVTGPSRAPSYGRAITPLVAHPVKIESASSAFCPPRIWTQSTWRPARPSRYRFRRARRRRRGSGRRIS